MAQNLQTFLLDYLSELPPSSEVLHVATNLQLAIAETKDVATICRFSNCNFQNWYFESFSVKKLAKLTMI